MFPLCTQHTSLNSVPTAQSESRGLRSVSTQLHISKTPRLLNTLENTFYPLDMLQVGFKRVSRSNLHNLMQTFSRDFFFFKLALYPFFALFSLFCTFSCLTHPSKLIMRKKVRPSDGQVVSSTHQAKQKWSQVKSRLYLNVLLLQNYCCYCPTHHSPLPCTLLLLPRALLLLPRTPLPPPPLPHAPPLLLLPCSHSCWLSVVVVVVVGHCGRSLWSVVMVVVNRRGRLWLWLWL